MAANISSTFDIVIDQLLNANSVVITNPGRAFRVVGVYITGADTAVFTLNKNSAIGQLVAQMTIAAATTGTNDVPCDLPVLTPAALTFSSTQNIFVREASGANLTRVVVSCEASNPEPVTVT